MLMGQVNESWEFTTAFSNENIIGDLKRTFVMYFWEKVSDWSVFKREL